MGGRICGYCFLVNDRMHIATIAELEEIWNAYADVFDRKITMSTNLSIHPMLINLLPVKEGMSVLEIGCGAGGGTKFFLDMKPKDCKFTAIDLAKEMIARAAKRVGKDADVKFEVGNAQELKFADGSMDRIFSNYVFHLIPDPDKGFSEAHRVLKKGGIAAFTVWGRKENSPYFTLPNKCMTELGIEQTKSRSPFHLGDKTKLREMALKAGFSTALVTYLTTTTGFKSGEEYVTFTVETSRTFKNATKTLSEEKAGELKKKLLEEASSIIA